VPRFPERSHDELPTQLAEGGSVIAARKIAPAAKYFYS